MESLHLVERYASHPVLLEKMFKEQIVRRDEIAVFETYLMEHQKAVRLFRFAASSPPSPSTECVSFLRCIDHE